MSQLGMPTAGYST